MVPIIITAAVTAVIVAVIVWFVATGIQQSKYKATVGSAEERSRAIIDDALKTAESKKREVLLEAKEENLKAQNELEKEIKERRSELSRMEKRAVNKEEALDRKTSILEKREASLNAKEESLNRKHAKADELTAQISQELERVSGMTSEQAKEFLFKSVENEVKLDTAKMIKEMEAKAKDEASAKAREYVVTAIQRCAADHVAETTISVVQLPNDEMKGRIIGREGRNIRTLETLTGVELIIDDTPEAVVLSSFDPMRREVARIALEKLILDGRIHPARIEEMVEKAQKEVEVMIREEGEAALLEVGVHGIHPELASFHPEPASRNGQCGGAGDYGLQHAGYCQQYSGKHVLRVILCRWKKPFAAVDIGGIRLCYCRKYLSVTFLLFSLNCFLFAFLTPKVS